MTRRGRASTASRVLARIPAPLLGNPFEVWVGAICVLDGLSISFGATPAGSIEALLPAWLVHLWAVELLLGGLLIVVGVVRRSYAVERAGLVQLGPAAIAYAIAIGLVLGARLPCFILAGFGLACLARAAIIVGADRMRRELLAVAATFDAFETFPPGGDP